MTLAKTATTPAPSTTTTTTTTAAAAPASPVNLFNAPLIAALVSATVTTEVDPAKLAFPKEIKTLEDRRLYALCMAGFVGGEAGITWRKRHAMEAAEVGYWRWALARASLFGSSVPSEALEAEKESRTLLEARRLRFELGRLTEVVSELSAGVKVVAHAATTMVAFAAASTPSDSPQRAAAAATANALNALLGAPPPHSSEGVVITSAKPVDAPATTPAAVDETRQHPCGG
jgi:hypothetical protein